MAAGWEGLARAAAGSEAEVGSAGEEEQREEQREAAQEEEAMAEAAAAAGLMKAGQEALGLAEEGWVVQRPAGLVAAGSVAPD